MKKLLLVSAVAALSVTSAYAETGVYGKVSADLHYAKDGEVTLDNDSSRIGVKGSTPITANTNAIYQAELGISIDGMTNDKDDQTGKKMKGNEITYRDTYLGLSNANVGTVLGGRLTAIDDNVNFGGPSDYWGAGLGTVGRADNAVAYVSPNFSGVTGMAMYVLDDGEAGQKGENRSGLKDAYGVAAQYATDTLKVGGSYIKPKGGDYVANLTGEAKVTKDVTLSAGYRKHEQKDSDEFMVAGEYDIPNSPWATYLQYDNKEESKQVVSLGGTYSFNKAVSARVYAGFEDPENGDSTYGVGTGLTYKF